MPNVRIPNFPIKRFAKNAGTNEITVPGTNITGNPVHKNGILTRQDYIDLQTSIESGLFGICLNASVVQPNGSVKVKVPVINEENALAKTIWDSVVSLYEYPLPLWDADREYFVDSIATNSSGVVYYSLVDNNINNALTDNTKWAVFYDKDNVVLRDGTKTMLADLDANGNSVINLKAPVNNNDAARKIDIPTPNAKTYSVNNGLLDTTTGLPNFLRRNTATELIILATAKNLVMTYANATQYTISADTTFDTSLLADGVYNLIVENGIIKAVLQSLISEVDILPITGVAGQYVTVVNPLVSYKWDTGTSAFVETNIVKLGEFQILAGAIVNGTVINYALNGIGYAKITLLSSLQNTTLAISIPIGSRFDLKTLGQRLTATTGYANVGAIGDLVTIFSVWTNYSTYEATTSKPYTVNANNLGIVLFGGNNQLAVMSRNNGQIQTINISNGPIEIVAERNF